MPRVIFETEKKRRELRADIRGAMELKAIRESELAKRIGVDPRTLRRKLEDPLSIKVGELLKISKAIGMPVVIGGKYARDTN